MRPPCKRVAVIGGGLAGFSALNSLKNEGIEPVCFEKSNDYLGTWCYRDQDIPGVPSAMWTTVLNHSKEFIFSDYVLPKETPNCLRQFELYDIFMSFVTERGLLQYCQCNREVILVKQALDYEETGRWQVTVKNTKDGNIFTEIFDGVLVCTGQFSYPKMAHYPGIESFKGHVMHTHSLKKVNQFFEKRIVVIGTGCSALDAAVESSAVARQVYLSVRTPSWIASRVGQNGLPFDYTLLRRYIWWWHNVLPLNWLSWVVEAYFYNERFNHQLYGIDPKHSLMSRDPVLSDTLPSKLLSGAVLLRKDINCFTENGVIFNDEKQATKADIVIMGTGYSHNFYFLQDGIVKTESGRINLYKGMYPTHLKHPTLAIVGFILPFGPGFPIGELQTRWAAHFLANNDKSLPSENKMLQDVIDRHERNVKRYTPSEKITLKVDYISYCDEIAKEFGVMPNFWKMICTDPKLFLACIFGPSTTYQYRLSGPGYWDGARNAILTSSERMQASLSPDRLKSKGRTLMSVYVLTNLLIPIILACLLKWKDSELKYYLCSLMISIYLLKNPFISKYFILLLLPYFFHSWHGVVALNLLTFAIFIYFNLGKLLVNRHFWI